MLGRKNLTAGIERQLLASFRPEALGYVLISLADT